ncbi:MAG: hypothetical protein UY50_C0027G0039 [Parcubacteria group bacterium GW2011_GWA2_49_9]|nr:MAG: hypothetical protein UY50_C0027G0039 [Parcubacteria group bacterium GW2011_GWA2_49_9]
MRTTLAICGVTLLMLFSPLLSYAIKSVEFAEMLSQKIFSDCNNAEISVRIDSFLAANLFKKNSTLTIAELPGLLENGLKYRATLDEIHKLIQEIQTLEPFDTYQNYPDNPRHASATGLAGSFHLNGQQILVKGEPVNFFSSGLNILQCGSNNLDVLGDQYFWNKKLFELPKIENNYSLTLFGFSIIENSEVTGIGITIFSFGFVSISLISMSVLLILIPSVRVKILQVLSHYNK